MNTEFEEWWNCRYPTCGPTGFFLREFYKSRWFRIHSLPGSKRYPENEKELKVILSRHNEIATDVLSEGASCFLTATLFEGFPITDCEYESSLFEGEASFHFDAKQEGVEGTDRYATWTSNVSWKSGAFDQLITRIANDESRHLIFVSKDSGRIYAPYDGGADLILESEEERNRMKEKYSRWLSAHPLGL